MSKLKEEELLEQLDAIFIGYTLFLIKGRQQKKIEEMEKSEFLKHKKQAFEQIKERLKKPEVTKEFVEEYTEMIDTDPHQCTRESLVGMLNEAGVEVVGG